MSNEQLLKLLKEKADKMGISAANPPLGPALVAELERQMNVRLPELLKQIYATVSNGGIGPGESLLKLSGDHSDADENEEFESEEVCGLYQAWIDSKMVIEDFDDEAGDVTVEWISGVLPLASWGCNVYTLLDCTVSGGMAVYSDLTGADCNFKEEWKNKKSSMFNRPGVPFVEWISSWLDDEEAKKFTPGSDKFLLDDTEEDLSEGDLDQALKEAASLSSSELLGEAQKLSWNRRRLAYGLCKMAVEKGDQKARDWMIETLLSGDFGVSYAWDVALEYAGEEVDKYPFYVDSPGFMAMMKAASAHNWTVVGHAWERRFQNKDAKAAYSLGWAKENGLAEYVKTSGDEAYKLAAEWGNPKAQVKINRSVSSEEKQGLEWLEKAAAINDTSAQYKLWLHYKETGDEKNALKYLKQAAKTRSVDQETVDGANAMIDLARLHIAGACGAKLDLAKAIKLLERASKHVPVDSCLQLGLIYKNDADKKDFDKALKWFRTGSERGSLECFYQMGLLYEEAGNLSRAATVLKIAVDRDHPLAAGRLEAVRARTGMT